MEIAAASVAANALRVGLNIAVGRNRPLIEFYYQVHNDFGPVRRLPGMTLMKGIKTSESEHRRQDVFVSIFAANIGSQRAEQVTYTIEGEFTRRGGKWPWGKIFGTEIRQMAPGQVTFLLKLDQFDLYATEKGDEVKDLILKVEYRAPKTLLNLVSRAWARWRGRSQFSTGFVFNGSNIATDLPPANYA